MGKKLLITVLAVVVGVGVVSGTRLGSLVRYWWHEGCQKVQREIPPETEIGRIRMELDNLARLDDRYFDEVARQKLEVRKLENDLKGKKASLAKTEKFLKGLHVALAEKGEFVSVNGQEYSRDKAQAEFNTEFRQFQAAEKVVKADEELLTALKGRLSESEQNILNLAAQRSEMKARLQDLAAQLARERRLQSTTSIVVDGNRYSALNKQMVELKDRIDALSIKREMKGQSGPGSIRAQEEAREEQKRLEQQAEQRFGKKVAADN